EQEIDWEEILLNGFDAGGQKQQFEDQEYLEPVCVETQDLIDHLREQLRMMELSPRQQLLSEELLGNISDEGYLGAPLDEMLNAVNLLLERHAGAPEPAEEEAEEAEAALAELAPEQGWIGMPEANAETPAKPAAEPATPAEAPRPTPQGNV